MALIETGFGDSEIARVTQVPRATISAWRHGRGVRYHQRLGSADPSWRPPQLRSYSYLLGLYLGDGCITLSRRATFAKMVITLDAAYPGIVEEGLGAAAACFPDARPHRFARSGGSVAALQWNDPALPFAFPQHSRGPKHLRVICLEPWQREITTEFPRELLRGLIHSDGCRTITASRPNCRAAASPATGIRATSSRICRMGSGASSVSTVSCLGSGGRSRIRATSPSRTVSR